eukprot:scaffold129674_cov66-Phaeocystis_antarctica.AAC.5
MAQDSSEGPTRNINTESEFRKRTGCLVLRSSPGVAMFGHCVQRTTCVRVSSRSGPIRRGVRSGRVRVGATPDLRWPRRGHAPQMAKPSGVDLVCVGQQHRLEDGQIEHLEARWAVGWGALEHRLE